MALRADIAITAGGTSVGYLRSADVSKNLGTLPAAEENTYGFERRVPGVFSWGVSGSTFLPAGGDAGQRALLTALTGRTAVEIVATFEDGTTETGSALVTQWDAEGSVGAAIEGSFSLRGTGALTPA